MLKYLTRSLLITGLFGIHLLFFSCEKEPEIITNTVIKTDTLRITTVDTVVIQMTDTLTITDFIHDTATTFILLRHAETAGTGSDPVLSAAGQLRAETLRRIMANVPLNAVYSTDYNRTRQTAQPVADDKLLTTNIYNPSSLHPLVDGVLTNHRGGTVLVLGHSNTTPALLNVLVGANVYANLPDTEYDNLFIVTVSEKGRSTVLHLKYGE